MDKEFEEIKKGLERIYDMYGKHVKTGNQVDYLIIQRELEDKQVLTFIFSFSLNEHIIKSIQKLLHNYLNYEVVIHIENGETFNDCTQIVVTSNHFDCVGKEFSEDGFSVISDKLNRIYNKYGNTSIGTEQNDYLIVQDDYGTKQVLSSIFNFSLNKDIIEEIKKILEEYPEWEVSISLMNGEKWNDCSILGITSKKWYCVKKELEKPEEKPGHP